MKEQLFNLLKGKEAKMIEIRRYLHENPELSFKEEKTSTYIADFYKDKDVQVEKSIGGYGVKVTIDSGKPGKTIAIRADFDALPIQEETNLPFVSKVDGVMHVCGHDAHTAYMLVLAETLIEMKDQLTGKVIVIHQPAEEQPPGGAMAMIRDGVLEGVDNVFGIHVMSTFETGKVFYREGAVQTGRAYFKVIIRGKGGHGSSPHMANDSIVAGAHFVTAVQTIVSRRLNPFDVCVITIGSFDGKGSFNVIKDAIEIEGDVRAMTEEVRTIVEKEIRALLEGIASMFGITYELEYMNDYPVLVNDDQLTAFVANSLKEVNIEEVVEVIRCEPQPPSEDFAYYALERPSTFFYIGAKPVSGPAHPHHHPKFDVSEQSLLIAAKSMGIIVLDYLEKYKV